MSYVNINSALFFPKLYNFCFLSYRFGNIQIVVLKVVWLMTILELWKVWSTKVLRENE